MKNALIIAIVFAVAACSSSAQRQSDDREQRIIERTHGAPPPNLQPLAPRQ